MALTTNPGESDFRFYRETGAYYVDKTGFLKAFLRRHPKVALFTRPRRFGKTMTMSMMAEFLDMRRQGNEEPDIFEGLEVTKGDDGKALCAKWKNQHPVVFVSFYGMETKSFDEAYIKIRNLFSALFREFRYLLVSDRLDEEDKKELASIIYKTADRDTIEKALLLLTKALHAHHGKRAILLIDEYDVPVAKARKHGFYEDMLLLMRNIFGAVFKDNKSMGFGVMTGCLRIARESIFTGLNNVTSFDISNSIHADAFGFTSAEVSKLLDDAGLSDRKEEFREWYNGYRFGGRQEMYCPWDIVRRVEALLLDPDSRPECFWANSSENGVIGEFAGKMGPRVMDKMLTLCGGGCVCAAVVDRLNYRDLEYGGTSRRKPSGDGRNDGTLEAREANFWSLLYHTGYLTMASEERAEAEGLSASSGKKVLVVPNREIAEIFDEELLPFFRGLMSDIDTDALIEAFWAMDAEKVQNDMARIMSKVGEHSRNECCYHGGIHMLLRLKCTDVGADLPGGCGRYDLLAHDYKRGAAVVVEVKRTSNPKNLPGLPKKALAQIVEKGYDAAVVRSRCPTVIHWGIGFCGNLCAAEARAASGPDRPSEDGAPGAAGGGQSSSIATRQGNLPEAT